MQGCYEHNTSKIQTLVSIQIPMIREYGIGKYLNSVPSIVIKPQTFDWKHGDTEVCDVIADYHVFYVNNHLQ